MKLLVTSTVFFLFLVSCKLNGQEAKAEKVHDCIDEPQKQQHTAEKSYTVYETALLNKGFNDVQNISEDVVVQLGYTHKDNFTGEILYDSLFHAFMRPLAYEKLRKAHQLLQKEFPNYTFSVFDALRPRSAQQKMWDMVEGTNMQKYVANPYYGSIHNYGLAIDLTIYDLNTEQSIDMGTEIDHLGREAEYRYNQQLINEGLISETAVKNRKLLRKIMRAAGFRSIDSEWWHFNALSKEQTRAEYEIVE